MKTNFKVMIGAGVGLILGVALPFGMSALGTFSFLRGDTPYETVLSYMLFAGLFGAVVGGAWSYRMARKNFAAK